MSRQIALSFLEHFCRGNVDALIPLLADDLKFSGPLFSFESAADYLEGLRSDPPEPSDYEVISLHESNGEVTMVYDYFKPDRTLRIEQRCSIEGQKIVAITLNFNITDFMRDQADS